MGFLKEFVFRLRGDFTTEKLISMGMKVGENFHRLHGVILDPSHCWLIEIGDNVTIAPRAHILCHDASTKPFLNYTKIGRQRSGVICPSVRNRRCVMTQLRFARMFRWDFI